MTSRSRDAIKAAVVEVIDAHTPSLSDEDDAAIWAIIERGMGGYHENDVADLAIRTCMCGVRIDGFYEYIDHLKDELRKAGVITDTGRRLT